MSEAEVSEGFSEAWREGGSQSDIPRENWRPVGPLSKSLLSAPHHKPELILKKKPFRLKRKNFQHDSCSHIILV